MFGRRMTELSREVHTPVNITPLVVIAHPRHITLVHLSTGLSTSKSTVNR